MIKKIHKKVVICIVILAVIMIGGCGSKTKSNSKNKSTDTSINEIADKNLESDEKGSKGSVQENEEKKVMAIHQPDSGKEENPDLSTDENQNENLKDNEKNDSNEGSSSGLSDNIVSSGQDKKTHTSSLENGSSSIKPSSDTPENLQTATSNNRNNSQKETQKNDTATESGKLDASQKGTSGSTGKKEDSIETSKDTSKKTSTDDKSGETSKAGNTEKAKESVQTFYGILIDEDCSDFEDPPKHDLPCMLMYSCRDSGYGLDILQADGSYQFYMFDENGQKLSWEYLNKTTRMYGLYVTVTGIYEDGVIKVQTFEES